MMENKILTFKIFRFNKETDYLPTYKTYEVEVTSDELILDVLNKVKWEQDGSLSYRRSCRHGICGACGVKVNGKSIIACKENVFKLVELFGEELTIDPQDTTAAVKDLIIDKAPFWSKYDHVKPYLLAKIDEHPTKENLVDPHTAELIEEADHCIRCGACYYACSAVEVNEDYLGPQALAMAYRFAADVRDDEKQQRLADVSELGIGVWDCVKCYECAEACPKGVNPIRKITQLHNMSFEEGVHKNNVATRHAVVFKNSIAKHGPLDEGDAVKFSEGLLGMGKHIPSAIEMFKVGKLPLPWKVHKSKNHDEVKKLVELASKNKF
jgi:succinate dehydrogenase / fumarate reductase iron-sulfur subunit